jgi:hypothetical protein
MTSAVSASSAERSTTSFSQVVVIASIASRSPSRRTNPSGPVTGSTRAATSAGRGIQVCSVSTSAVSWARSRSASAGTTQRGLRISTARGTVRCGHAARKASSTPRKAPSEANAPRLK